MAPRIILYVLIIFLLSPFQAEAAAKRIVSLYPGHTDNIVALGGKARSMLDTEAGETDFRIGIKDPQSESGALLGTLPASNLTVVTSGTYERYFIADGKKYHHILDSETGYPTDTDVLSATIIAAKGRSVDCDGLSTTCLALGIENALALVNSIEGVEAILVDTNGKVHQTSEALNFAKA